MKSSPLLAAVTLGLVSSANAAIVLDLSDIRPANSNTNLQITSSANGTLVSASTLGSLPNATASTGPDGALTWTFTISGANGTGFVGANVTFDLTATPSAGDGLARNGGGANPLFVVDLDGDGVHTDPPGSPEAARIDAGETIQFSLSNATINGSAATISNVNFHDANVLQGILADANLTADGLFSTTDVDGLRLQNFDVSFEISPVPEPSSTALLGLGGLALLARRKR